MKSAALVIGWLLAVSPLAAAQEPDELDSRDLTELSLEELLEVEVSVTSRHGEKVSDIPAAVYVLTGDEIRRAGFTSVQEAMRMVPGFHVAQWKTAGWDVTARGFTGSLSELNESFANQLLLIVDGVHYYNPVMAGIWWPLVDVPMDDIERIEIVRGPGGSMWGVNAMNGVVQVVTKHARDTQGAHVLTRGGTNEISGDARYGGKLGENGVFRTWLSYSDYRAIPNADGDRLPEDWWIGSFGFRGDFEIDDDSRARIITSLYTSEFGEEPPDASILGLPLFDETPKNGGSVIGSWETGDLDDMHRVNAWYSIDHQKQLNFESDLQTLDLEYTRNQLLGSVHSLTWGVGARVVQTNLESPNGFVDFEPEFRRMHSVRAFAQDEIELESLRSRLVFGLQAEESDFTGFHLQPNARWLWHATENTSYWAALSYAERTPSVEERDTLNFDPPTDPPFFQGADDFDSEELLSTEIGGRATLWEHVFLDIAAFYNDYEDLQSFELDSSGTIVTFGNNATAVATGVEVALDWDISEDWRIRSAYTFFEMDFEADPASFEAPFIDDKDGLIPRNHANVRSYYDITTEWELNTAVYWTDELEFFDSPSYWRWDLGVAWDPRPNMRLAIGGQNLTEDQHAEAGEDILNYGGEVPRSFYIDFRVSF